jgi:hypothetical protein
MAKRDKDIEDRVEEKNDSKHLVTLGEEAPEVLEVRIEGEDEENAPSEKEKSDDQDDDDDHGDEDNDGGNEDDREAIREARREERRLKKELQKQREASSKHKITALERRNAELAERLAKVENTAASYQFAQIDKQVEDEATRVEYAKMKMVQAAQSGDVNSQMEYLEQLTDAKQRLQQAQHYKQQQVEAAKSPRQNVPNPLTTEVQEKATKWLKKNSWYDPQARDTDSRIAKVVDQELAADGWDPSDSEYWEELDNRLSNRLPHRYTSKGGSNKRSSAGPTASSRTPSSSSAKAGTITLSRERVSAIKDAGAWDDTEKRNKMIRAYARYDRENKG